MRLYAPHSQSLFVAEFQHLRGLSRHGDSRPRDQGWRRHRKHGVRQQERAAIRAELDAYRAEQAEALAPDPCSLHLNAQEEREARIAIAKFMRDTEPHPIDDEPDYYPDDFDQTCGRCGGVTRCYCTQEDRDSEIDSGMKPCSDCGQYWECDCYLKSEWIDKLGDRLWGDHEMGFDLGGERQDWEYPDAVRIDGSFAWGSDEWFDICTEPCSNDAFWHETVLESGWWITFDAEPCAPLGTGRGVLSFDNHPRTYRKYLRSSHKYTVKGR